MKKQLFVIDDYRIWATSYEQAQEHYKMIVKL